MSELDYENEHTRAWREIATSYPEVEETPSCTKCAFKARNKGFLYVGADENTYNAMVKLGESLPAARALEAKDGERYRVGSTSWVTITFPHGEAPPEGLMERWIDESFRLQAPRKLLAALDERG